MISLLACAGGALDSTPGVDDTAAHVDLAAELASPGPYGVGYAAGEVTYADPVSGADRTLRLASWYPTDPGATGELAAVGLYVSDRAVVDAPALAGEHPVAVFSHGHQGYAENSSFLLEHLASHGWWVLAPDHTGNTTFDGGDRETGIYLQRPLDLSAVLDAAGAAGPVLAIGHSFGGYTVWPFGGAAYDVAGIEAACAAGTGGNVCHDLDPEDLALLDAGLADDRVGAIVPMAGGDFDLLAAGVAEVQAPVLMMTASLDQGPGSVADSYWGAVPHEGNLRVILEGGGHQSFTDYSDVLEDVPLSQEESFRIVDSYVLAWGRHMLGDPTVDPVLDGTVDVSSAASFGE